MHLARMLTPLGEMLLAASDTALVGAWFFGQRYFPAVDENRLAAAPLMGAGKGSSHPLLQSAVGELSAFFTGALRDFGLPLAPQGTPFQQRVWQALLAIPYGESRTYSEIARSLAADNSCRAVGAAVGRNPISIFIPCHRVLGKNGSLTGYAGGLARKEHLIKLERKAGV